MSRSALHSVKPAAIYNLSEVFEAVRKDKEAYEAQLVGKPDWAQHWPPKAAADALGRVMDQLNDWKAQGVTEIQTDAPFSDGCMTGAVEDMITSQFRQQRVQPKI